MKLLPNVLTLLNLLSGCMAVLFVFNDQIKYAAFFVITGIVFDFFDGFTARLLKVQSDLGKQLDSLADMITSGFVPGLVMVQMLLKASGQKSLNQLDGFQNLPFLALLGFGIALASCYRLANFNIDERQKENFIGLPTPANTLLILSISLMSIDKTYSYMHLFINNTFVLLVLTALSCYLLNANIELFSLKFKTFSIQENKLKYLFLMICLFLLVFLKLAAIPLVILIYVSLSLVNINFKKT